MSVFFHREDRDVPKIDKKGVVSSIIDFCTRMEKEVGNINFIYCSDEFLLEMNIQYLDHDYLTDVITFNYCENKSVSGDIFMSRDRMDENAEKLKIEKGDEYLRVCAHGFLHLLGFNDNTEDEKTEMRKKEDKFIQLTKS